MSPLTLTSLPPELLLQIASKLPDRASLNSFLQTNRYTHALLHSTLYTQNIRHDNSSALIWAATCDCIATAKHLINYGADIHAKSGRVPTRSGKSGVQTPFTIAARAGHMEMLRLLISSNGGVIPGMRHERENERAGERSKSNLYVNRPLLAMAAEEGQVEVVEMLLEEFNVVNVDSTDWMRRTALSRVAIAAASKHGYFLGSYVDMEAQQRAREFEERLEAVMRLLLKHGANPRHVDKDGRMPLAVAAEKRGSVAIARLLLEYGADPNQGSFEGTPLMLAARSGCIDVVRLLLEYCDAGCGVVDLEARDRSGVTAIGYAVRAGQGDIARLLLDRGVDPDSVDDNGYTPIFWAVEACHEEMVRLLLSQSRPVDVNRLQGPDRYWTVFTKAMDSTEQILWLLLSLGKHVDINSCTSDGMPALVVAAVESQKGAALVRVLLGQKGIIPDQRDRDGMTALAHAVRMSKYEVAQLLLKSADVDVNSRDYHGRSPVCHVYPSDSTMDMLHLLVKHGADVDASEYGEGQTLFERAWRKEALETMDFLFKAGADPKLAYSRTGTHTNSELHLCHDALFQLAMRNGHASLLKHILAMDLDDDEIDPTNTMDELGRTPLCYAALHGFKDLVKVLLAHRSTGRGRSKNIQRASLPFALTLAAMNGHDRIVLQLLDAGAHGPKSHSDRGFMRLLKSMDGGYQEVMKMYMRLHSRSRKGGNPSSCYPPWLPLFFATVYGHQQVVKTLIASQPGMRLRTVMDTKEVEMEMEDEMEVEVEEEGEEWGEEEEEGEGEEEEEEEEEEKEEEEEEEVSRVIDMTPLWLAEEYVWATGGAVSSSEFVRYQPASTPFSVR
ncbi:hypothetical protein PAAG_08035 [Paracoccidioides lutzii Pb01]|uniref:Uncharacterized protein n=1 Tax=Paracoccidioides lutzii (strain ATCC MYA-826 / Pb01) TaxID=502779 RepID=C1HB94_PARBA|nr:hypothetical protein PAAG_08035 [Paracoccidioides lutzii Pb01]EEH37617.1 hypothetical protein PAAG_08035 [Paracoccidioides lutzii Pb01]